MIEQKDKLSELLKIINISEEEFKRLNYKEMQRYFRAKSKLCKVFFVSRSKDGKGLTYKKNKELIANDNK